MELIELSMQVARIDERTQTIREEMHNSFHRIETALRKHIEEDEAAHHKITELEHIVARGKGAWKLVMGAGTAFAGLAGVGYYLIGILHHGA